MSRIRNIGTGIFTIPNSKLAIGDHSFTTNVLPASVSHIGIDIDVSGWPFSGQKAFDASFKISTDGVNFEEVYLSSPYDVAISSKFGNPANNLDIDFDLPSSGIEGRILRVDIHMYERLALPGTIYIS